MRRRVILAAIGAAACRPALAQSWPTQPIRLVVPYAAGGPTDVAPPATGGAIEELTMMRLASNQLGAAREVGQAERPLRWPPFPRMVEENSGSPFCPRLRRVPDRPEPAEPTRTAITLGGHRAA